MTQSMNRAARLSCRAASKSLPGAALVRAVLTAAAVVVAASATSASAQITPELPVVAPGTWVIMGTSTASGAGAKTKAWVDLLKARYGPKSVTIVNIAKGGTTTYAGLSPSETPNPRRPLPEPTANIDVALGHKPTLLLLSYPSNDNSAGYTIDEPVDNILSIRAAALKAGTAVIVLSTQPLTLPPARLALQARIDTALRTAVGPCFVEVREALSAPDGKLAARYDSGDTLHPNDEGHALIHSRLSNLIDSNRCVRVP